MTFVVCRNLLHAPVLSLFYQVPGKTLRLLSFFGTWQLEGVCENWVIDDSVGFAKQDGLNEMPH